MVTPVVSLSDASRKAASIECIIVEVQCFGGVGLIRAHRVQIGNNLRMTPVSDPSNGMTRVFNPSNEVPRDLQQLQILEIALPIIDHLLDHFTIHSTISIHYEL